MPQERFTIVNPNGDRLAARLDSPGGSKPHAYALFAHCFTCSKNLKAIGNISRALNQEGIAVLRFDFTGIGESEGDFADTNFTSNVLDLVVVADYLREQHAAPQILIGHSLGGAAVMHAAHHIPEATAVATIAAPCEPGHMKELLGVDEAALGQEDSVMVRVGGQPFPITRQFLHDLGEAQMRDVIQTLGRSLLVLHSPRDEVVNIDNAACLFQTARHPKSFVSLDKANHLLGDAADSRYVGALIATWASRYIS